MEGKGCRCPCGLIGMIGLLPLPGSPLYRGSRDAIEDVALGNVVTYAEAGLDGILIENSGDLPYIKGPLPESDLELVTSIAKQARGMFNGSIGLQLLEARNLDALKLAALAGLDFIRVEGYVFAHVGGAGIIEGCAGELLRLRKQLAAESIQVFADVKKKHCSHALTSDLSIEDTVRQSEFFLADGIIVTGSRTGSAPACSDLTAVRSVTALPVLIGSGMTATNIGEFFHAADGFIVGTDLRADGQYLNPLDPGRLNRFVETYADLKSRDGEG